jgi:hypothetical protein
MASSGGATDFPTCAPFAGQPYLFNPVDNTVTYETIRTITVTQAALLTISTFAHMNYSQCGQTGWIGQLAQTVQIFNANDSSDSLGSNQTQSPKLTDDSAGVTIALSKAVPKGTYNIVIDTNWATFAGNFGNFGTTLPWTSNFCGATGIIVPTTPVATGWTIDAVY